MKPLHLLLAAGLLGSAWFAVFGDKTPDASVAELPSRTNQESSRQQNPPSDPPSDPPQRRQTARTGSSDAARTVILPLKARPELISAEKGAAKGDLFERQAWVAPVAPVNAPVQQAVTVAVPALTYVGKKQEDGVWEVYLALQDQLFIVKDKTVIEGKYRVESIVPPKLVLTYLPLSQKQTVMIGDAQ